jgi:colanic acid biosynthesis glycosyl transferase WcaI
MLLINDFGGYAFIDELAVELGSRGASISHSFCKSLTSTPPGVSGQSVGSENQLGIALDRPMNKYAFVRRRQQEIEYGKKLIRVLERKNIESVVSANMPLDAQKHLWAFADHKCIKKFYWLQDLLGEATVTILRKKLGLVGRVIGNYYQSLERKLLRESHGVISICESFDRFVCDLGVERDRRLVLPNWANLSAFQGIVPVPHENENDTDRRQIVYSGTLSMKHNPQLIVELAKGIEAYNNWSVLVRSQGSGADFLKAKVQNDGIKNLFVEPFLPINELPNVLSDASILLAILEPEASQYSVPSKVLTYLCSGRPILLAMPAENLAAKTVLQANAGRCVPPDDSSKLVSTAIELINSGRTRQELGKNGRRYAEENFSIADIADRIVEFIKRAGCS